MFWHYFYIFVFVDSLIGRKTCNIMKLMFSVPLETGCPNCWFGYVHVFKASSLLPVFCQQVLQSCHYFLIFFHFYYWKRSCMTSFNNLAILKQFLISSPPLKISPGCSWEGLTLKLKFQYLATWCEELTHLKRPWCWERLKVGGEGDNRGWASWMASLTQWTWVWVNSRS